MMINIHTESDSNVQLLIAPSLNKLRSVKPLIKNYSNIFLLLEMYDKLTLLLL
jgi:hypothetical protein